MERDQEKKTEEGRGFRMHYLSKEQSMSGDHDCGWGVFDAVFYDGVKIFNYSKGADKNEAYIYNLKIDLEDCGYFTVCASRGESDTGYDYGQRFNVLDEFHKKIKK